MTTDMNALEQAPQTEEKKPFVSVMILCYNYASTLGKALDACAAQTFRDFEIVMINNGSIDDTEAVFQRFCKAHPDVHTVYVHVDPNNGPTNGWNRGLEQAHGEYVMFHDADDWMDPDCLEQMAQKARQTGADRVAVQYRDVLLDGTVVRERKFSPKQQFVAIPVMQGVMFRRAVIEKSNLYLPDETRRFYDAWFYLAFEVSAKNRGALVYSAHYNYLINPGSDYGTIIKKKGVDTQINEFVEPMVRMCMKFAVQAGDQRFKHEIQYVILRGVLSVVISSYRHLEKKEADALCARTFEILDREMPDFRKNPLIWPFGNGYELPGSAAIAVTILLEKFHATGLLGMLRHLGEKVTVAR